MEEIISNIMQSPENTNPNVLRGQLQSIGSGSSGMNLDSTVLILREISEDNFAADKTYDETLELFQAGVSIWVLIPDPNNPTDDSPIKSAARINKYEINITREFDGVTADALFIEIEQETPFSYWSDGKVYLT